MSWIQRIQENIVIETGDGKLYLPEYLKSQFLQEYNIAVFDFIDVPGSFVRKRQPKGRKFALEIYFIGDDNLDISEAFRVSASDQRHWHIRHPLYDEIRVQPQSLKFDNTEMNVSKITGLVIETGAQIYPRGGISNIDQVIEKKALLDITSAANYADQTNNIQSSEIATIQSNIDNVEAEAEKIILNEDEKIDFKNLIFEAKNKTATIIGQPLEAITAIQAAINYPFQIINNVEARVQTFINQFNRLITTVGNITDLSRNDKKYFEVQGANLLSAAITASITNLDDFPYQDRKAVNNIFTKLVNLNNSYIENIDGFQTESQTELDSYAPDPDVLGQLQDQLNFTLSELYEIALNSQQEHIIINEAQSNAIILTHRVYGLDNADLNLDKFIKTNQIGLNEILEIPKGKELIYYV